MLDFDKTLAETSFGKKLLKKLGTESTDWIDTKIHAVNSTKENPIFVKANVYEGKTFGKLTAHAMERCPVLSLAVLSAIELPQVIGAFTKGNNIFEKGENGAKQVAKSAVNVASIAAGIGYMGAIGSKLGGPPLAL